MEWEAIGALVLRPITGVVSLCISNLVTCDDFFYYRLECTCTKLRRNVVERMLWFRNSVSSDCCSSLTSDERDSLAGSALRLEEHSSNGGGRQRRATTDLYMNMDEVWLSTCLFPYSMFNTCIHGLAWLSVSICWVLSFKLCLFILDRGNNNERHVDFG